MIWMRKVANDKNTVDENTFYVVNSLGMGNYRLDESGTEKTTPGRAETGSSEDYKVKNIYDLAGNVIDWTLEAYTTSHGLRITRGRSCFDTRDTRASAREGYMSIVVHIGSKAWGSRVTLY